MSGRRIHQKPIRFAVVINTEEIESELSVIGDELMTGVHL
jgi:hypothetical protein